MESRTKLNVFRLVKRLEEQKNEPYTNTAIADKTGLSRVTVNSLVAGSTNRIDLATIDKLLDFFAAEGMPITPGDLFTVTPD
jgi:hypothetical protein